MVLIAIERDNDFIGANLALSASCDLMLNDVIERGQQARVFNYFTRYYYTMHIYINHQQFATQYITVQRPRTESSYSESTWLTNPPLDSLLEEQHTIAEPITHKRKSSVLDLCGSKRDHRRELDRQAQGQVQHATTKKFAGGFVLQPAEGFYYRPWEAVATVDFNSLYPSIIEGYRVCYMRVIYDQRYMTDPLAELEYVPLDDDTCCVMMTAYAGQSVRTVTDQIMREIVKNRKQVRTQMLGITDPFQLQSLDARQLSCKVLQNGSYGFLGSVTSGMLCTALAAMVCLLGGWMNRQVRAMAMQRGCRCVYGDTDSLMIQFPTRHLPLDTSREDRLASIYQQAQSLVQEVGTMFPAPNGIELEGVKLPMYLTDKKKTYAADEYPGTPGGWLKTPKEVVKGFTLKKRDKCGWAQTHAGFLLRQILNNEWSDTT